MRCDMNDSMRRSQMGEQYRRSIRSATKCMHVRYPSILLPPTFTQIIFHLRNLHAITSWRLPQIEFHTLEKQTLEIWLCRITAWHNCLPIKYRVANKSGCLWQTEAITIYIYMVQKTQIEFHISEHDRTRRERVFLSVVVRFSSFYSDSLVFPVILFADVVASSWCAGTTWLFANLTDHLACGRGVFGMGGCFFFGWAGKTRTQNGMDLVGVFA